MHAPAVSIILPRRKLIAGLAAIIAAPAFVRAERLLPSVRYDPGDGPRNRYNTIGSRVPVDPSPVPGERTLALICTGQSPIGNWGSDDLYTSTSPRSLQANVLDGLFYPAADPMFGCDGGSGGPSSAIPDMLIADRKWDCVAVANVSYGSTSSEQWADPTGELAIGLKSADALFREHGYTNILQLHHQGEQEASTGLANTYSPEVTYATWLANLTRLDTWRLKAGMNYPMYVSQSTFSWYAWDRTDPDAAKWTPKPHAAAVRAAQLAVVNGKTILRGPDTDAVRGPLYRMGAHYDTQAGALAVARLWANTIPAA